MGVVVEELCPNCKKPVYMPLHCPQMRCPNCKEADIINKRKQLNRESNLKRTEHLRKKPHLFHSFKIKNVSCPKCGTEFSCSQALSKGKIFCPKCATSVPVSHEE